MITLDRLVNVLAGSGARLAGGARAREVDAAEPGRARPDRPAPDHRRRLPGRRGRLAGRGGPPGRAGAGGRRCWSAPRHRSNRRCPRRPSTRASPWCWPTPRCRGATSPGLAYGLVLEGRETESGRGPTDLFALADTLAAALGDSSVVIEDQLSRVLAYSSSDEVVDAVRSQTILGRRLPDRVRELFAERGVFRHLAASDEPLFVEPSPAHGFGGRMVVAVRAGRELLGLAVGRDRRPLRRRAQPGPRGRRTDRSAAPAALARQRRPGASGGVRPGHPPDREDRRRPDHDQPARTAPARTARRGAAGPRRGRAARRRPADLRARHDGLRLVPAGPQCPVRQHRLHPAARRGRHGRGPRATGWRRCAPVSPATWDWWPGSAVRPSRAAAGQPPRGRRVPGAARRPSRAPARGVRRVLGPHRAPSPASRHRRGPYPRARSGGRAPSGTTGATGPTTSRPCGPGWPPTGTSVPPRRPSTSTRTPCGTACGRSTRPLPSPPTTPTSDSP